MQWEIIEINAVKTLNTSNMITQVSEYYKRCRLKTESLYGEAIVNYEIDDIHLFNLALKNIKKQSLNFHFTNTVYLGNTDDSINSLKDMERNINKRIDDVTFFLKTSNGGKIIDRKILDSPLPGQPIKFNENFDVINKFCDLNEIQNFTWIFTPEAFSKIIYDYIVQITIHKEENGIVNPISIMDPGNSYFYDLEGTKIEPIYFYLNGKFLNHASDNYTSSISGKKTTGHRGLSGINIRDLSIKPSNYLSNKNISKSVLLIVNACLFKHKNKNIVSLTTSFNNTIFVEIEKQLDLINNCSWLGRMEKTFLNLSLPWASFELPTYSFKICK